MLILTRRNGESLVIGEDVKITILDVKKDQVKVGIHAPTEVSIYREEIYQRIQSANNTSQEGTEEVTTT